MPEAETRTIEEVIESSLPTLWYSLDRAQRSSAFWRSRLQQFGIESRGVRSLDAFHALPLLEKQAILLDQQDNPPYGSLLAVHPRMVRRIHRTSGTTASPLLVLLTRKDVINTIKVGACAFRCAGVTPSDVVIHCLNYCMWSGGITDHQCIEAAGATVVPFGVGNSHVLIETILRLKPTAISCTPSYMGRLRQLVLEEFGKDPRELKLRKLLFGGEAGLQDARFRSAIEKTWGAEAIDANYGLSDVLSVVASECVARNGLHFHAHGTLLPEIIDVRGRSVEISKGVAGELVLTTLLREAQPLFRYRTRDLIRIVDVGPCHCGRGGFRFTVIGRTDDMIAVKGVNFHPSAIQGYLATLDGVSGEFRVYVPPPPIDWLRLDLEKAPNQPGRDWFALGQVIASEISRTHAVKVDVRFVDHGLMPSVADKTIRILRD